MPQQTRMHPGWPGPRSRRTTFFNASWSFSPKHWVCSCSTTIRNHRCKWISSCQVQRYFYFSQIFCSTNSVGSHTKFSDDSKASAYEYDLPVFLQLYALLFATGWCLHENDLMFKGSEGDSKNPYSWGSLWKISFLALNGSEIWILFIAVGSFFPVVRLGDHLGKSHCIMHCGSEPARSLIARKKAVGNRGIAHVHGSEHGLMQWGAETRLQNQTIGTSWGKMVLRM